MSAAFDAGSGQTIVLLHGIGSRWQLFAPILDALTSTHRVLALDLPGFGANPRDSSVVPSAQGYATWVAQELERRGITDPHVVGSSLGGGVALELARAGVATRVTAFAPIGFWSPSERRWAQTVLAVLHCAARRLQTIIDPALGVVALRALILSPLFGKPASVDAAEARADMAALAGATAFAETQASFTGYVAPRPTRVPVTIAWGSRDRVLLFRPQRARATTALPSATHVVLEGCGHLPFSDDPAACVAAILSTVPSAPAPTDLPSTEGNPA